MLVNRHPVLFYTMVGVSFLVAFLITVIPLSNQFQLLRPELIALLVIYWIICVPQHLGMTFAFAVGLIQDVCEQVIWGAHALALTVVAYICLSAYQRIKSYSVWHQTLWVCVLIGMHQVFVNWVHSLFGYQANTSRLLASVVISTLLWPVVSLGLRRIRTQFRLV